MSVTLSLFAGAGAQFFDNNGNPLSGGKIYTYAAGTTTPNPTYTTRSDSSLHTNPIVLDAAGRVPSGGEIWLQLGVGYKFVVKTSAEVLIATYDNIPSSAQPPAANDADSIMYEQGYTVTAGSFVVGKIYRILTVGTTNFTLIGAVSNTIGTHFIATGVGTGTGTAQLSQTVETKLQEFISVKDFGAVGDGVTDSTVAIKACLDYAIPLGIPVEFSGTYLISGPLQPYPGLASGAVEIICRGDVTINVSAGATAFADLLYIETTSINSCSITGGTLTINANNKCARGITFRHANATQGGRVAITTPVTINNLFDADASATREVTGIVVYGLYEDVTILNPRVVGVRRTNPAQASKGIAVSGYEGTVLIDKPYIKDVLLPAGAIFDCDGIAVFAKAGATTYALRQGSAVIRDGVFIDCAGRAVKSQSTNTQVIRPIVKRQFATPTTASVDFDFQVGGGGALIEPQFEYLMNGASSPLSATHVCVAFQQRCDTTTFGQMVARAKDAVIRTEVAIYIYCALITSATATRHETIIDGLVIEPLNAFWATATTAITRSVLEFDANIIATQTAEEVTIRVNRVKGPIQTYFIAYTGLGAPTAISKLRLEAIDNENTLPVGLARLFTSQSGSPITGLGAFKFAGNSNIRTIMANGFGFDFRALQVGTAFSVVIDGATFNNPPPWGVSGTATVLCTGAYFGNNDRTVQVWLNNATATPSYWFTVNGGTTWGQIK